MDLEGTKMKDLKCITAILSIVLCFLIGGTSKAATLSLDLDRNTPGIQSTRTLSPGSALAFEVVFSGDGTTQFDTFALDVLHTSPQVSLHSPFAGPIADGAPLMALDLYGANAVSSGDALTLGTMPIPLGFEGGLGGVGVSSVGGMPFPLLGQDETVGLFSGSLTAHNIGLSNLALSGYPFGVGAELSLVGERVQVTLQEATVTIIPLPPVVWLFASGVLTLLGIRRCRELPMEPVKRVLRRWLFLALGLITPLGFAAVDSDADLNGDAMVTSQDISLLANCFGQDPLNNSDCTKADVDEDGDIDADDFSFISARLGEAYPWRLYSTSLVYANEYGNSGVAIGDINGDGLLDVVAGGVFNVLVLLGNSDGTYQVHQHLAVSDDVNDFDYYSHSIALGDINGDGALDVVVVSRRTSGGGYTSIFFGNGDGSFPVRQRYTTGWQPCSVALGDVNGDGSLDMAIVNCEPFALYAGPPGSDLSVLLGNGDGSFQEQQRIAAGSLHGSVTIGDINRDGSLDVVLNNGSVLLGNGDGSFQAHQPFATGDGASSVALGDINGDGLLDVVLSNGSVLLGNGDGTFQSRQRFDFGAERFSIASVALGDINGDDTLDVVVADSSVSDDISVSLGNGDGSFQAPQDFAAPGQSVALSDLNGDGILDVVTSGVAVLLGNTD
jgi:hypothetical protein